MKKLLILSFLLFSACGGTPEKPLPPMEGTPIYKSSEEVKERVVYVSVPLPMPIKPQFPKIKGKDLRCLSPTVQWELKNRDTIMKDYIYELEAIIRSTHAE